MLVTRLFYTDDDLRMSNGKQKNNDWMVQKQYKHKSVGLGCDARSAWET